MGRRRSSSADPGVTDQRNRFIASAVYEPASFDYALPLFDALFKNWKVSSVITLGSGRLINATIAGDANTYNDRLAGVAGNSYVGPVSQAFQMGERVRLTCRRSYSTS